MSSDGSDIEMKSALPIKPKKKMPKSPTEEFLMKKPYKKVLSKDNQDSKKLATKTMIHEALVELKSRKGVSMYAIKKYLKEKYDVDTEKINYIIKKYIKKAVEEGTIVQTKGTGASGSFKLVAVKEKKIVKPKMAKIDKDIKEKAKNKDKSEKMKNKPKKTSDKTVKSKSKPKENNIADKPLKSKKKIEVKESVVQENKDIKKEKKIKKNKTKTMATTPAKKKMAMMKRKSIGSIIKAPKMKPSAKA